MKEKSDRTKRKHWAEEVFKRDNNTCQKCGATKDLHAHHIIEWAVDASKRFDINNGLTVCADCHKAIHGYELNDKQKLFCLEYLKDFNALKAYKTVYGTTSDNVAGASGSRLLKNVKVIEFLNAKKSQITAEKNITVDWVLNGIKSVGDNPLGKDNDKLKAYQLGGEYLKMFTNEKDTQPEKQNINITISRDVD